MRLIGFAGWSGAGKTTLLQRLIPALVARGLTVSTVKHAHHAFDVDQPGKDSYLHRQAGATEVLVGSTARWALMHEHRSDREPELPTLLARMSPVDLILVEGFKRGPHRKIEVHRAALGKPLLHSADPTIVALAADPLPPSLPAVPLPTVSLNDIDAIVRLALEHAQPVGAPWP